MYKCPACGNDKDIRTERRPHGDSTCPACGHKEPTSKFIKVKNSSIDSMAQQFNSIEELQAYSEAQYKTIITLNEKINGLQTELDKLKMENVELKRSETIKNSTPDGSQFKVTDEEAACVVQIALLKDHAMSRELVTDEVKRLEILVKTLQSIRAKVPEKNPEKDVSNVPSEDLLKQLEADNKKAQ